MREWADVPEVEFVPRVGVEVSNVAELDACPIGTVIYRSGMDGDCEKCALKRDDGWVLTGVSFVCPPDVIEYGRAWTIIRLPEGATR